MSLRAEGEAISQLPRDALPEIASGLRPRNDNHSPIQNPKSAILGGRGSCRAAVFAIALGCLVARHIALAANAVTPKGTITITVKETAGLRRFGYPVTARVSLPRGQVSEVANLRLSNESKAAVGAQFTAMSRHSDNSIAQLDVDFTTSPLPFAEQKFFLDYGAGIVPALLGRGLSVTETSDGHQVGAYSIPKSGELLIRSVKYGEREFLGEPGGFTVTARTKDGRALPFDHANVSSRRVLKSGPINATVLLEGAYKESNIANPARFRTVFEFVSSKSWVHLTHQVDDPLNKVEEIILTVPFALEAPLYFDFGVGSWLYGWLHTSGQNSVRQVKLRQTIIAESDRGPRHAHWEVVTGQEEIPYASAVPIRPGLAGAGRRGLANPWGDLQYAEGWAHLNDAQKVIAMGIANFTERVGEQSIEFDATGNMTVRYRPPRNPQSAFRNRNGRARLLPSQPELSVFVHFVGVPVQRTAATSPPSMLAPLEVTWRKGRS